MKKKWKFSLRFGLAVFLISLFFSCVTEKRLVNGMDPGKTASIERISNTYSNSKSAISHENLAEVLKQLHRTTAFERIPFPMKAATDVKLELEGENRLRVTLLDSISPLGEFVLKVKKKDSYLSIKRKMLFIPVPMLFTIYKNRKGLLYVNSDGNLVVLEGRSRFVMILMAAGDKSIVSSEFHPKDSVKVDQK